jgi:hypothetical protein
MLTIRRNMKTIAKVIWGLAIAVFVLILMASCGGNEEVQEQPEKTPETTMSPSQAFCSDLIDKELSLFQIYASVKDSFDGPQDFADFAYGAAAISCPEELKNNEFFRGYLMDWGINPDA